MNRRHDIDNLRIICIFLLMFYHAMIVFTNFASLLDFPQNDLAIAWVPNVMGVMNIWRIPLLFFVSGMGLYFAFQRRSAIELFKERCRRILIPLLFGIFLVVPFNMFLIQQFKNVQHTYQPFPAHLWFMLNIMIYVLLCLPLFHYFKIKMSGWRWTSIQLTVEKSPYLIFIPGIVYVSESFILPESGIYIFYASTLHGFFLGLVAFIIGFLIIMIGDSFWSGISKFKWVSLFFALGLHFFPIDIPTYFNGRIVHVLQAAESYFWVMGILGVGYSYLNISNKLTQYLGKSVLPMYIIHMTMLNLSSMFILSLSMSPLFKLVLITSITVLSCIAIYEWVIKRVSFLRLFFGIVS